MFITRSGILLFAGVVLLAGCQPDKPDTQPDKQDSYYGAYSAKCEFSNGDARSNLLDAGQMTAAKLGQTLKVNIDEPDGTIAIIDLPWIAGASPYRQNSSGQVVFSDTAGSASDTRLMVAVFGSLQKDPRLVATVRAAVEEGLRRHGCSAWTFDDAKSPT